MLIAARNSFLTGGAKPPYDAEVEYLATDGAAYVVTDVYLTQSDEVELVASGTSSGTFSVFAGQAYYNNGFRMVFNNYDNYLTVYFSGDVSGNISYKGATTGQLTTIRIQDATATILVNGSQVASTPFKYSRHLPNSRLCLLGVRDFGSNLKTHSAKSGTAIHSLNISGKANLIPVRIGSVGYLYDRANPDGGPLGNGLYPNAGTGAFVVGPDKP